MRAPLTTSITSLVSLALLSVFSPAFANETDTYTCTPDGGTPDATSRYINVGSSTAAIDLQTVKGGNSIAGIYLAEIPYPPNQFTYLQFILRGGPDAGHGPYLIMDGWDKKKNAETIVVGLNDVKPVAEYDGVRKYVITEADLKIGGKAFFPVHIYIQDFPGTGGPSQYVFQNFKYNGQTFTARYGELYQCFSLTTVP